MHRRLSLTALAGLALGLLPGLRSQPVPEAGLPVPETYFPALKPLIEAAVRQSPQMIARQAEDAQAEGNRMIAKAEQLPRVGGNFGYLPWDYEQRVGDPQSPYTSQKTTYALNLVQPLYHWGALENATRIADLQVKISQGQTAEAYRILVAQIRQRFLELVIKKASLARTRAGLQFTEQQYAVAKDRFERHLISESELVGSTVALEQARLGADQWEDDFESSRRQFAKLLGGPPFLDEEIPAEIPEVTAPLDAFEGVVKDFTAQKDLPAAGLETLRDQIESEKLRYQIASARLRPKVNAIMGTNQDEQSYTANIGAKYGVTAYYVGVQLNWTIFDGYATKGEKANALIRRRQLERNYAAMSVEVREQVQAKWRQLHYSARSLETGRKSLGLSAGNLSRTKDNFAHGLASETDVRSAELGWSAAQIEAYRGRADYLLKLADFLGTLRADPALSNSPGPRP